VFVVRHTNQSFETILSMDLRQFTSIHGSCIRLFADEMRHNLTLGVVAARGSDKSLKDLDRQFEKHTRHGIGGRSSSDGPDGDDFIRQMGSSF